MLLVFLILPLGRTQAQYANLNFTGGSAWNSSSTIPATSNPYVFPDGVSRSPADFVFRAGTSSIWNLNNGCKVICTQSGANPYNRFFVGSADSTHATLTFTTSTLLNPGLLCARLSNVAAIRLGEAATNSRGTLRIDGGVRIQTGYIFGEGPTPAIQIPNGRLDVLSGYNLKRLNGIAISLGAKGKLWILDPTALVTSGATFSSFASGATITAPGGNLIFQNNVAVVSALGDTSSGTLISVNSSTDNDNDGLPDAWEFTYRLDPSDDGSGDPWNGPLGDPDSDGSGNLAEYQRDTNPQIADTDGDGLRDGVETSASFFVSASNTGSNPLSMDSDLDSYADGTEVIQGSDPNDPADPSLDPDRDRDGLPNTWETANGLNPDDDGRTAISNGTDGDPDNDGLPNSEEYFLGSNPKSNLFGYAWQSRPLKADVLVIAAHPDDEAIFFGGTLPYYSQVAQTTVALISMTSGDYLQSPTIREKQLIQAAWAYGIRNQPLFPRFKNTATASVNEVWDVWADGTIDGNGIAAGRLRASYYVAGMIRRFRPEVLATHGANGEYGHNDHIATSQAVVDAWSIAANSAIEINGLPAWQVKKLYLHEWGTNRLFHDFWENPFAELDGKTPRAVAINGLTFHANHSAVSTVYLTGEVAPNWDAHPSEWWGLHSSTVGSDTVAPNFTVAGVNYNGWAKGNFLGHVTISPDSPPKIVCPSPIQAPYPWSLTLPAVVTDDSPSDSRLLAWSLVSGPGEVKFTPSTGVQNPIATFSKSGLHVLRLTASDANSTTTRDVTVRVLPAPLATIRAINCGGPEFTGRDGTLWQADSNYTGGTTSFAPDTLITSTGDDALFQSQRVGACSYAIPLATGTYLITLRFAETETTKTQSFLRRFHITLENSRVETSLDPFATVGFARAFDRTYSVSVSDGMLNLQLAEEIGKPVIAAILIRSTLADIVPPPTLTISEDTDGDGVTDEDEFIAGTSPITPDAPPLALNLTTHTVRFLTRVAEGDAYLGLTRRYRVEASLNLNPESWITIWEGAADGNWKDVTFSSSPSRRFFRLVTILQ